LVIIEEAGHMGLCEGEGVRKAVSKVTPFLMRNL
jgi:hypothetical protein